MRRVEVGEPGAGETVIVSPVNGVVGGVVRQLVKISSCWSILSTTCEMFECKYCCLVVWLEPLPEGADTRHGSRFLALQPHKIEFVSVLF